MAFIRSYSADVARPTATSRIRSLLPARAGMIPGRATASASARAAPRTRAGMIPEAVGASTLCMAAPCTRGDNPEFWEWCRKGGGCSPHARGMTCPGLRSRWLVDAARGHPRLVAAAEHVVALRDESVARGLVAQLLPLQLERDAVALGCLPHELYALLGDAPRRPVTRV